MSEESKPVAPPPPPKNASEAAQRFMGLLPHVEYEPGKWAFGYYRNGQKVFIPASLDRAMVMGTMRGIAEGRVSIGDKQILGSVNVAFHKPIVDAIDAAVAAAKESGDQTSPDIVKNRELLDRLCWGIEQAASFGIFTDQTLRHNHTRHPVGFVDTVTTSGTRGTHAKP